MKNKRSAWLLAAAILVIAGLLLLAAALTMADGSFAAPGTDAFETSVHEPGSDFRRIAVFTDTADIALALSEDGVCRVVFCQEEGEPHSVSVKDGTLSIQAFSEKPWYDFIGLNFQKPQITLYLPETEYEHLGIGTDTGDAVIPRGFVFGSMDISTDTGDVTNGASASGEIAVETDTGDIRMENLSAGSLRLSVSTGRINLSGLVCEGDLRSSVSTGRTDIRDSSCLNFFSDGSTGELSLTNVTAAGSFSIGRSTGDVHLSACDAAELDITTDTGDVTGSLLSEKIFLAHSGTGDIDIPDTLSGGLCEISTDTGDIEIFLYQ